MRKTRLLSVAAPAVAALSLLTVAATRPAESPGVAEHADAKAWVRAHHDKLPTGLEHFARFSKIYQLAIFGSLSTGEQRRLYQEHLEAFLLPASRLSPIQREIVQGLPAPLTANERALVQLGLESLPRIFDGKLSLTQLRAIAKPLCDQAKVVFGAALAPLIFGRVGPRVEPLAQLPSEASLFDLDQVAAVLRRGLLSLHLVTATQSGACECAYQSFCDCGGIGYCNSGSCNYNGANCGCFSVWNCDGLCNQVQ